MNIFSQDVAEVNERRGSSTGFADERPELTYTDDDGGSPAPLEDMMEPTGSSIDAMTQAIRRAKARLMLIAPEGAQPSIEWSHRLTTYSDGRESIDTGWMVAVHVGTNATGFKNIAFARADTLDAAVLKCVAALVDRKPATADAKAAGLERALADVLDDDYPDAEARYHAEHGSAA